jgi:hypothetical protein
MAELREAGEVVPLGPRLDDDATDKPIDGDVFGG